jgi:hypothetical protein
MKFFELSLRLYDRGSNDAMSRYRLLCFDGKSETTRWEAYGSSIGEVIFRAGYLLVREFALGLNKQP